MSLQFQGKNVAVTGGGSGIGLAIVKRFAENGAKVNIIDINRPPADSLSEFNENIDFHQCDVSDCESVHLAFQKIGKLDILVNNAGIAHIGNIEQVAEKDFDKVFAINVKGVFNCAQAAIKQMKLNGEGNIINIASIAGTKAVANRFVYSASKGAVVAMTYSIAQDYLSDGIRCNSISPARIHTPFVDGFIKNNFPGKEKEKFEELAKAQPIGRMGTPEEVAALAIFLASDDAKFITGNDYPIDGGYINLK